MGKTITPKYRIEYVVGNMRMTPARWDCRQTGRPTNANLAKHMGSYMKSFEHGGVNYHVSEAFGELPTFRSARIIDQFNDNVVAEWKAPMFMVV